MSEKTNWELLLTLFEKIDLQDDRPNYIYNDIIKHLEPLANNLKLAKVSIRYIIFPNVFQLCGNSFEYETIYNEAIGDEEDAVHISYDTIRHEKCDITLYPVKGHEWDDLEYRSIKMVSQIVTIYMTRGSLINDLKRTPFIDILTGLDNSPGVIRRGGGFEQEGTLKEYASVFFNFKNFNYINKKYGIANGDLIIKQVALRMFQFMKQTDGEIASRFGGDNFFALVKKEHLEDFLFFLNDINIIIDFKGEKVSLPIKVRAGIFDSSDENTRINNMITNASVAFSYTKKRNTDFVRFTMDMFDAAMHDKKTSMIFPAAMANKEIVPFYQPKYNIRTNEIIGAEALVRWIRNGSYMSPGEFLPALEAEGSIRRLDFYMLEEVCSDLRRWLDEGIEPVRVSINYSKLNLQNPRLVDDTMAILEKYDIDPKYIEIEITETSSFEDVERMREFISCMHEYGITISMDDFGTGYSSLNIFKDLDFDVVKLDKTFIDNIEKDVEKDTVIMLNMIKMLNELKIEIIAEGVETTKQIDFLREHGCDLVQGYYFSKPVPREEFREKLLFPEA